MTYLSINERQSDGYEKQEVKEGVKETHVVVENENPTELSGRILQQDAIEVPPSVPKKKKRLLSLDILRGISVIMMIIVNNQPGDCYWWLEETTNPWVGLHPGDFIFAFFLFCMGYAMGIVFSRPPHPEPNKVEKRWLCCCIPIRVRNKIYLPIAKWVRFFRRVILLILLGLLDNFIETLPSDIKYMRWSCTLCRIGVAYLITGLIMNLFEWMITQIFIVAFLHVCYLLIMYCIPIPGCGAGNISKECSAESYFDQKILGRDHMWMQKPYDPEGTVSTLPTVTTVYFGVIFFKISQYVKRKHDGNKYTLITIWMFLSAFLIIISVILNYTFVPYIKELWNTPWVLISTGTSGVMLSFIMWVVDIHGISFWTPLFVWTGVNPLFMYVVPIYVGSILDIIKPNGVDGLDTYLWRNCFQSWIKNEQFSSLVWGILYESVFVPFSWYLYWRQIYIKL